MQALLLGIFSFVPMAFSDLCYRHRQGLWGRVLFAAGCGLLCISTILLFLQSSGSGAVLPWVGALISLILLVYSITFGVRPSAAEQEICPEGMIPLVNTGMYALCRHPGVLWLGAFYGCCFCAFRSGLWLAAFLCFTACDTLYVLYQDRYIFPHTIHRYGDYQKTTPFLIPTLSSIREALPAKGSTERSRRP